MVHECVGGGVGGGGGGDNDDDDGDCNDAWSSLSSHFPFPQRMLSTRVVSFDPDGSQPQNLKNQKM